MMSGSSRSAGKDFQSSRLPERWAASSDAAALCSSNAVVLLKGGKTKGSRIDCDEASGRTHWLYFLKRERPRGR